MAQKEIESVVMIWTAFLIACSTLFFTTGCAPDDVQSEAVTSSCACSPGDLVITELMINPPGEDSGLEYVEIMNVSDSEVVLDGLVVISGSDVRPDVSSIAGWISPTVRPGDRFVVSEAPPSSTPDMVTVGSMLLSNAAGSVTLMCGPVEIDVAAWGESPMAPPEGRSLQRAPSAEPGRPAAWCASDDPADENGLRGSPGTQNHECAGAATCLDPVTGRSRPLVRPARDDMAVTEVFANPDGSDALENEWLEVVALSSFDIGGATIRHFNGSDETASAREFRVPAGDCHPVGMGDVVVIGGRDGIPLEGSSQFFNATGGVAMIQVVDPSGNVVATARHPKVPDGASVSLKTSVATGPDAPAGDDDPASWVTTRCAGGIAATPGTLDVTCPRR